MKHLLIINSSARVTRSITRQLTRRAETLWLAEHPDGLVEHLDVGLIPPPAIDESWIAAAYTRPPQRTPTMNSALQISDRFIDQLIGADAIVLGAPLYNFGIPAQLKAYFEQIVRIGRTFDFGSGGPENPYVGLLADRPVLVVTSSGSSVMPPGGASAHLNFLEPQLVTVLNLIGLTNSTFVRVSGQQAGPEVLAQSIARAEQEIDVWLGAQRPAVFAK